MDIGKGKGGRRTLLGLLMLLLFGVFAGVVIIRDSRRSAITFASVSEQADSKTAEDSNNYEGSGQQGGDGNEGEFAMADHNHPAFSERVTERERMVTYDIKNRGVDDANVLRSMRTVPRHAFVQPGDLRRAYADHPLPIGLNQTISQPYIVAYMTEYLDLDPNAKVFEVGTGSGYQAAVCAEIAREVYTVEILGKLAGSAKDRLEELGYRNVSVRQGDGYFGWKDKAPFDAIIITAATGFVPPPLIEQLRPGGRMILPLGSPYGSQWLVLITKDDEGEVRSRNLLPVRFVPMTGRVMGPQERSEE